MYSALYDTSNTIKKFLEDSLKPPGGPFPTTTCVVSLDNPEEMKGKEGLSLWLYRIVRDDQTLNMPPKRVDKNYIQRTPLPFRLHYLITPLVKNATETEQQILGKVLQLLYDHPVLRGTDLQNGFKGTSVELNVRLEPLSLEEITRVWDALDRSYQLSVSYEVSVVCIESGKEPEKISQVEVLMPEYSVIISSEQV